MMRTILGNFLVATALATTAALAAPTVDVPQGGIGVWRGDGDASCGMVGKTWQAIDGDCYYPVDFERKPGKYEIARWDSGTLSKGWLTVTEVDFPVQEIDFPDESYVHLSVEDLERHYNEQAEIKPLLQRKSSAKFSLPLQKPAEPLPEGQYFGVPRIFNGEPKNAHTGIDYAVAADTPVRAVANGTVLFAGEQFFAGNCVYIDHGGSLISMYFHLDDITTEADTDVTAASSIATVGSTGRSTGPHLHLGLRWQGARIDPTPLFGDLSQLPSVSE